MTPETEKRGEKIRVWHYDHKKVPGAYNVCRLCGREHDVKKDMDEAKAEVGR